MEKVDIWNSMIYTPRIDLRCERDMAESNPHIGSSLDDFLAEEGILEECTEKAIERVLDRQKEKETSEDQT
jgi:hypothetical protein